MSERTTPAPAATAPGRWIAVTAVLPILVNRSQGGSS